MTNENVRGRHSAGFQHLVEVSDPIFQTAAWLGGITPYCKTT